MAGGGPLLDDDVGFDPRSHTAVNGVRLVSAAFGDTPARAEWPVEGREAAARLPRAALTIPAAAHARADALLSASAAQAPERPLVGLHVGAGRAVKEWPASRLADVGGWAVRERGAVIVLTGSSADRAAAEDVRRALPGAAVVIDTVGHADLLPLAAVLSRLSLFVTPDTGPMHLAAAVGTPIVALFGPSSPERWGPLSVSATHRPRRSAVQPLQPHPAPARPLPGPYARLHGRDPDEQVIEAAAGLLPAWPREDARGTR